MNWRTKSLILFITTSTVIFLWIKKENFFQNSKYLSKYPSQKQDADFINSQNSNYNSDSLCKRDKKALQKKNLISKFSIDSKKHERRKQMNKLRDESLDLIVKDIKGETWDLYCYKNQKHLIINLWATWCSPCVEELLSLSRLAEQTKEQTFVIALSTESPETLSQFIKKAFPDLKKSLKIASFPEKKLRAYFPEDPLPVTYIFNKEGRLSGKESGARDWGRKEIVESFLE